VKQFFAEVFTARATAEKLATSERRATSAARRLSSADREVQFVRATYIPEDEICFFVFDASSGHDAALAARRAGLEPIRVVEAVSSAKEEQ
jgi:acid phosphatase class B